MTECILSLVSNHQQDTNNIPAVRAGTYTHTRHNMTRMSKAITSIATGMGIGTAGDIGLATSQWLTAVVAIAIGFALIVNGFVIWGTQSCEK